MRLDNLNRPLYDLKVNHDQFASELQKECNWFSGVADSVFKKVFPLLNDFHFSPRENHAISMAFGAKLAGANPAVLIQNSGLGLSLDALLGTFTLYNQGLLLVVSNRGTLEWEEIQHQDWGKITCKLLKAMDIPFFSLNDLGVEAIARCSDIAFKKNKVCVLLIERGNIDE